MSGRQPRIGLASRNGSGLVRPIAVCAGFVGFMVFMAIGLAPAEARPLRVPLLRAERRVIRAEAALEREAARAANRPRGVERTAAAETAPAPPAKPLPPTGPTPANPVTPAAAVTPAAVEAPGEPAADGTVSVLVRPESAAKSAPEPLRFPGGQTP